MLQKVERSFSKKNYYLRILGLMLVILVGIFIVGGMARIPQDSSYHFFADDDKHFGTENASNVISNLGFVIAGIIGLLRMKRWPHSPISFMWRFFFCSILLVGFGSAYYHWNPSNDTLFWDRLPMTMGFASLMACICAERFSISIGRGLFAPLVISGAFSVVYWLFTENIGVGDLRPYIVMQYFPMILIPLIIILFPQKNNANKPYWIMLTAYIIAKTFELQDDMIFQWTNHIISGHTLKHIVAAAGILMFHPKQTQ